MSMNPRKTTDKIRSDYQDYISSILTVKDKEITDLARKAVLSAGFVKGPYLESILPFDEIHSLKDLAESGLISKEFEKMGKSVHYEDWKLRVHQEAALEHVIKLKRNMVVSTGTGSGKTECYLYPIINSLMREKENGTLDDGVRALLVFPMNALANDQQKKLRKILRTYPDITFGRYTGESKHKETYETPEEAEDRLHEEYDNEHYYDTDESLQHSISNEIMCREMMVKRPPHILLTNYAMLEYLLLQPDTAPFFDDQSARNWRFIVLDEAHTYKGATGTEIAYLIRRVKERIRHNMKDEFRCIATSATLGSNDGKAGLARFASNLFGEPFNENDIISAKRNPPVVPSGASCYSLEDYKRIKQNVTNKTDAEISRYYYQMLKNDLRVYRLYDVLRNKPRSIEEVADVVFEDISGNDARETALIDLIEMAAMARMNDDGESLLPARYHLFIKSLEGLFAQLYPSKKVYLDRKEKNYCGDRLYSVFELANCQKCNQEYIVGKIKGQSNAFLIQTSSLERPDYFFISPSDTSLGLTSMDDDDLIESSGEFSTDQFHLCLSCGRITPYAEKHPDVCCGVSDPNRVVTVYQLKYKGKNKESSCCPCCGATRKGLIKRFLTANQPATFSIAKSLYECIPPRPIVHESADDYDIFNDDLIDDPFATNEFSVSDELINESGRKLLIFSDNRQEAAFFGGFFENKYSQITWRKLILKCLRDSSNKALLIPELIKKVRVEADKTGIFAIDREKNVTLSNVDKNKLASYYVMQEFLNPDLQTGLERLGFIQVLPKKAKITGLEDILGYKENDLWNIIRFLMDTLRQRGVVTYPEEIQPEDELFEPRNHQGYFRQTGNSDKFQEYVYGFIPERNKVNKRYAFFLKLINDDIDEKDKAELARNTLENVYKIVFSKAFIRLNMVRQITGRSKSVLNMLNHSQWGFRLVERDDTLFQCEKCGKVFGYSIGGVCPELKCTGKLNSVKASVIQDQPFYKNLYSDSKIIPMVSREHTAQLANDTARNYQELFENGTINVLSCSTTFEMGVDVGELEATFLRNIPPETSNYIQRAGRAGRRASSAAFSVSFARRTSHDMTFFQDPPKIIAGKISPPILEIDNEKIAERHLNSIVISWFFKKHREFFEDNTKRIVYAKDDMRSVLEKDLSEHPKDLLDSIRWAIPENVCKALKVDEWAFAEELAGAKGSLARAIKIRQNDINGLEDYEQSVKSKPNTSKAEYYSAGKAKDLIDTLEKEKSINFLSAKGILPKYGFPIDSVSLDILNGSKEESGKIELSRDLKMAIREFAPPSKIVANGKVWESYAINTVPNRSWPTYIYHECPKCNRIIHPEEQVVPVDANLHDETIAPIKICDYCGTKTLPKKFIMPIFGFSTKFGVKPKHVGEEKPATYYATQTQYWGIDGRTEKQISEARENEILIKGKRVIITYSPGGKLYVLNQGIGGSGFWICPSCGYATDPIKYLPKSNHRNKMDRECKAKMFNSSLGQSFLTDILKIKLPDLEKYMTKIDGSEDKDILQSVLFALLEGASVALDISRDDISGCVAGKNELVLFDDTAGGSGYVKSIYSNFQDVLLAARNKVSGQCGCTSETSCYGCLRNYSNQSSHDVLSRGLAKSYLDCLLELDLRGCETEVTAPDQELVEECIGMKTLDYDGPDTTSCFDVRTQLHDMMGYAEDDGVKIGYKKLIDALDGMKYEKCISDVPLHAVEDNIWPDLVWPQSRVALFLPNDKKQFDILKKYNWYCYIVDENINAELILSHIKER